jgi:hypothetical protein
MGVIKIMPRKCPTKRYSHHVQENFISEPNKNIEKTQRTVVDVRNLPRKRDMYNDEVKKFTEEHHWIIREHILQEIRENFLSLYKEDFTELLLNLLIIASKYPESYAELETLADDENKELVNTAREAFEDDFAEALCSIKGEVPKDLIDDFEAELNKFGKSMCFNDAKQDWYKKKDVKLPKNFDVTEREYCGSPLNLDTYMSGKRLMEENKSWKYENEIE